MTKRIEAEGGELVLRNKNGSVAIIPAKHRQEVLAMVEDDCNHCLDDYIKRLPKYADVADEGSLYPKSATSVNPITPEVTNPVKPNVVDDTPPLPTHPYFSGKTSPLIPPSLIGKPKDVPSPKLTNEEIIRQKSKHLTDSPLLENRSMDTNPRKIDSNITEVQERKIDKVLEKAATPKTKIDKHDRSLINAYNETRYQKELEVENTFYKNYNPSNKAEVQRVQQMLVDNDPNALPKYGVDGYWGDETKTAYNKYVKDKYKPASHLTEQDVLRYGNELTKTTCESDQCATYVSEVTGLDVLGSAWEMKHNIEKKGGIIKYNIYEDERFNNVTSKNIKFVTDQVKSTNKATADMFEVGDVVGLYNRNSSYHDLAIKESKGGTKNTHVGIVTAIKDGVPIISHNIYGKLHHDPYNRVTVGWIGASNNKSIPVYEEETKPTNLKEAVDYYTTAFPKDVNVDINPDTLKQDILGILQVESGGGKHKPTEKDINKSRLLRGVIHGDFDKDNVSMGASKIKLNTFTPRERKFLNLTEETIQDDATAVKATTYLYVKNYKLFKEYSDKNPQLHLTEDDIRDMTILAHNQNTDKLLNLGYNTEYLSMEKEVERLRELRSGKIDDISSTKFKYLPLLGKILYDLKYPGGHKTYISRVREHGTNLTQN